MRDVRLTHARSYLRVRRAVLAGSIALLVIVPLLSLRFEAERYYVGAPFAVRVFGLEILDPLAALSVVAAGGISWKVLLGALPATLLIAVFGRFFCGWLCPYIPVLAASNALRGLLWRFGIRTADRRWPSRTPFLVLGALLVLTLLSGAQLIPLFYPPSILAREIFRAVFFGGASFGLLFIGAAFLFDTFVTRAGFCAYLCPGGATFSIFSRYSRVQVTRVAERCTDCEACDVVCNLLQSPMNDRVGAGCERCGKCISACPTDALSLSRSTSRLPIISAEKTK